MIAPLMVINPLMTVVLGLLVTDDPFGARIAVGSSVALFGALLITISPEQARRVMKRV